jgi:hypothetical protein
LRTFGCGTFCFDGVQYGINQCEVGQSLGEISEVPTGVGIELLAKEAETVRCSEQPFAQSARSFGLANLRQRGHRQNEQTVKLASGSSIPSSVE